MSEKKYRLVTRSDFDGLVCAILLKHLRLIDEICFVHPKDMQDGVVEVSDRDISTNLPYVEGIYVAFDHHHSETLRNKKRDNHIIDEHAPSTARVVWRHFKGHEVFPEAWDEMMDAVDKADSADFCMDDILHPRGWTLMSFLMDARTGLGRFRNFRISNYELMMNMIDYCVDHSIDQALALPDVRERVDLYCEHEALFKDQVYRCSQVYDNLVVLDLREEETIYAGNRFIVYALHPEVNISITVLWGKENQKVMFATGKSIFDRSSKTNIGELMLRHGGGGHEAAGTCQVDAAEAESKLKELIAAITADG